MRPLNSKALMFCMTCTLAACETSADLGKAPLDGLLPDTLADQVPPNASCVPNPCNQPNKTVCTLSGGQPACSCDKGYIDDGAGGCKAFQNQAEFSADHCGATTINFSDPSQATLTVTRGAGSLDITGENADWKMTLSLAVATDAKAPLTLDLKSFPSKVSLVQFTSKKGLANITYKPATLMGNDYFTVNVSVLEKNLLVATCTGLMTATNTTFCPQLSILSGNVSVQLPD